MGYVDERDIVVALVVQCGLPYIAVNKYNIDPAVLAAIPKETVIRERLIPLDRIGGILSVVMANPLNDTKKAELEALTKSRVAIFIATKTEIDEAIAKFYN